MLSTHICVTRPQWVKLFKNIISLVVTMCVMQIAIHTGSGLILGLCPANERLRYFVTTSLSGWAQALNQPCGLSGISFIYMLFTCYVQIFSYDQATLRTPLSVCLSHFFTMFLSSYHHEIFRSYYQWQKWCPCKRSRSLVKCQGHRCHNPT